MPANVMTAAMRVLERTGANGVFARVTRPRGVILMLHRVAEGTGGAHRFRPNADFAVSASYLGDMIRHLRSNGWDIVTLDDALTRLRATGSQRRFAVFTFDDGYRDNLEAALPVFQRHGAPFTVYATTGFVSRQYLPWWYIAEAVLASTDRLDLPLPGFEGSRRCASDAEQRDLFYRLRAWLMSQPPQAVRRVCDDMLAVAGIGRRDFADSLLLGIDGLRELATQPEVTIGAHAHSHSALASLADAQLDVELGGSCRLLASWLGRGVRHYCYPFGGARECGAREERHARAFGLSTATTTRKAVLQPVHASRPLALPRVAVRGSQQSLDLLAVQVSGLAPTVNRWVRRLRPAARG